MLHSMKLECFGGRASLTDDERDDVLATRTIYEFDDRFVAPRNGFRSAEDYYDQNHARRFLAEIRTPTLVIHAQDDPWIPADAYLGYPWRENPALVPLLPKRGGHVGFHDRSRSETWHDRCIGLFVEALGH
jgi:predicted alpha/beta-fold hydrolase